MSTTTFFEGSATLTFNGHPRVRAPDDELVKRYECLIAEQRHSWTEHHHLNKLLGSGGQGVVYLSQRRGTDQFTLPVAL
ncbi:MAG TPA: serine/threonine protein kinase, partial [Pirellulales bacterium]